MAWPLVTVVTPVLNGARFIRDCLDSVKAQDYPRIEHIVVDGGSTDATAEIVAKVPGVRWSSAPDRGMYDAVNRGFRQASGEILTYQNADDRYASPDAVRRMAEACREADADCLYGGFRVIAEDGRVVDLRPPVPFTVDRLMVQNIVPPHALFVRRAVVQDEGFWLDPSLRFAGDWEWVLRMALGGKRFAPVPVTVSDFRRHHTSMTATFGWAGKLREWRLICTRHHVSLVRLLWHESVAEPVRRRLRRPFPR